MDRPELAAFLRSRRARLRPEDVGLPSGPRRRTPGLRREEVAVAAHISTEYYVRLEQGRAPRPSTEVLAALASALLLTDAERSHLHVLAGTAPAPAPHHRRDVHPTVQAALDGLPGAVGFVVSAAFEVLAWNELATLLMEDFGALPPAGRNLARRAFADGQTLYGAADGTAFRHEVVRGLRSAAARYPDDPVIAELVAELRGASDVFSRLWDRHDVQGAPALTKTFDNAVVGRVTVDCVALDVPDRDQHVVLYTPVGATDAEKLALLTMVGKDAPVSA
ncbi:helix-turn-helix transcriptional regulator [Curtobacterium luteum]|uniref:XRE family transcriptional regulator n=1 Tax=Curtobacterium luteum TaxID=33881 RepID=A0A175RM30_9MICO|nr:helix-turn-helix transcriptional regulator [Curtobacterium luteum]KTR04423.1 XRE family transcriptional regulator [Curtobacterium luteum]